MNIYYFKNTDSFERCTYLSTLNRNILKHTYNCLEKHTIHHFDMRYKTMHTVELNLEVKCKLMEVILISAN